MASKIVQWALREFGPAIVDALATALGVTIEVAAGFLMDGSAEKRLSSEDAGDDAQSLYKRSLLLNKMGDSGAFGAHQQWHMTARGNVARVASGRGDQRGRQRMIDEEADHAQEEADYNRNRGEVKRGSEGLPPTESTGSGGTVSAGDAYREARDALERARFRAIHYPGLTPADTDREDIARALDAFERELISDPDLSSADVNDPRWADFQGRLGLSADSGAAALIKALYESRLTSIRRSRNAGDVLPDASADDKRDDEFGRARDEGLYRRGAPSDGGGRFRVPDIPNRRLIETGETDFVDEEKARQWAIRKAEDMIRDQRRDDLSNDVVRGAEDLIRNLTGGRGGGSLTPADTRRWGFAKRIGESLEPAGPNIVLPGEVIRTRRPITDERPPPIPPPFPFPWDWLPRDPPPPLVGNEPHEPIPPAGPPSTETPPRSGQHFPIPTDQIGTPDGPPRPIWLPGNSANTPASLHRPGGGVTPSGGLFYGFPGFEPLLPLPSLWGVSPLRNAHRISVQEKRTRGRAYPY